MGVQVDEDRIYELLQAQHAAGHELAAAEAPLPEPPVTAGWREAQVKLEEVLERWERERHSRAGLSEATVAAYEEALRSYAAARDSADRASAQMSPPSELAPRTTALSYGMWYERIAALPDVGPAQVTWMAEVAAEEPAHSSISVGDLARFAESAGPPGMAAAVERAAIGAHELTREEEYVVNALSEHPELAGDVAGLARQTGLSEAEVQAVLSALEPPAESAPQLRQDAPGASAEGEVGVSPTPLAPEPPAGVQAPEAPVLPAPGELVTVTLPGGYTRTGSIVADANGNPLTQQAAALAERPADGCVARRPAPAERRVANMTPLVVDWRTYYLETWWTMPGRRGYEVFDEGGNSVAICRRFDGVRDEVACARAAIRRKHRREGIA